MLRMFIKMTSLFSQPDKLHKLIDIPHVKAYGREKIKNLEREQAVPKKSAQSAGRGRGGEYD